MDLRIEKHSLPAFAMIIAAMYYCLPIVQSNLYWGYALVAILCYISLSILTNRELFGIAAKLSMLSLMIVWLLRLLGDVYTAELMISKFTSFLLCVIFPILLLYQFSNIRYRTTQIKVLAVTGLVFAYTSYCTYKELLVNPTACRMWEIQEELYQRNVGHFDFSYSCTVMFFALYLIFKSNNSNKRSFRYWLCAVSVATSFLLIIMTQYTLAMLITFIELIIYTFFSDNDLGKRKKTIRAVFILFFPFLALLSVRILLQLVPYEGMQKRLGLLYAYMTGGDYDRNSTESRAYLYVTAIKYFLKGFLTGNRNLPINAHSSFLSISAHTGVWGAVLLFFLYRDAGKYVEIILNRNNVNPKLFLPVYIAVLVHGFTNPLLSCYSFGFLAFFFVPGVAIVLNKKWRQNCN